MFVQARREEGTNASETHEYMRCIFIYFLKKTHFAYKLATECSSFLHGNSLVQNRLFSQVFTGLPQSLQENS